MLKLLFLILLFFVARFIWRYIVPVVRLIRNTHRKMNEMNQQMNNPNTHNPTASPTPESSLKDKGEYIDYEELQ
jgi:hypothetical protein